MAILYFLQYEHESLSPYLRRLNDFHAQCANSYFEKTSQIIFERLNSKNQEHVKATYTGDLVGLFCKSADGIREFFVYLADDT